MFEHTVARGRELGAARVELEAEHHAVGFYEKLRARATPRQRAGSLGSDQPNHGA
jgi:hypothetical protein